MSCFMLLFSMICKSHVIEVALSLTIVRRLWDIDATECTHIVEDAASKQEVKSSFHYHDPSTMDDSPIMMVKSIDGEGQVVQVLEPPTGDKVSHVYGLLIGRFLIVLRNAGVGHCVCHTPLRDQCGYPTGHKVKAHGFHKRQ